MDNRCVCDSSAKLYITVKKIIIHFHYYLYRVVYLCCWCGYYSNPMRESIDLRSGTARST